MIIVIPMAGRGSRFSAIGVSTPKPLIKVRNEPMYAWAMKSLPLSLARRIVFICLDEHLTGSGLAEDIEARFGQFDVAIVPLDGVTEGQACTVLKARSQIEPNEPLLIYNADTYCRTRLSSRLPQLPPEVDGLLGVFEAPGDRWSFARCDSTGRVVETAEKRRISDLATTGLYYFRRGHDFVTYAEAMIEADERVNGEFYVAPVYNRMITDGRMIWVDHAMEAWVLGTPEDMETFAREYPARESAGDS